MHRFTVDRHLVETCIEASALIRRVARPDVLMAAALLHDIGKGRLVDHCVAGEPLAREVAARMGFDEREVELVGHLVRWHLLLAEVGHHPRPGRPGDGGGRRRAGARPRDARPAEVLTEADARATSPKAWTSWRAGLVADLVRRARGRARRTRRSVPAPSDAGACEIPDAVLEDPRAGRRDACEPADDGATVTVVVRRPGRPDRRRRRR